VVTRSVSLVWPRPWSNVLAWALWAVAMAGLAGTVWLHYLLRRAGRPELMTLDPLLLVAGVSATMVGAVLAVRRPRHPVGWLLLVFAGFLGAAGVVSGYAPYGLLARPGSLPAAGTVALYYPAFAVAALATLGFVLLFTPTGSLPSPRWRWWAWITALVPVAFLTLVTFGTRPSAANFRVPDSPFDFSDLHGVVLFGAQSSSTVTVFAGVAAAASLVLRFRRARGQERRQLSWVALAAALVALLAVVALAGLAFGSTAPIGSIGTQFAVALLPVAIGAAILRYRLYDLDRLISRALAYGLLSLLLGGGYAAAVLGLGQVLGRGSSLSVAGATLAVAGAFQPARRRVQQVVDRRFNRRRYDATQTIETFSVRLRQEIDLDTLTGGLLAVVVQTMQPTHVSVWLRPSDDERKRSKWTGGVGSSLPT
jgi:hypothetical protein